MMILGVDPGTTSIGYALIEGTVRSPKLKTAGLIPIKNRGSAERIKELHGGFSKLIKRWGPEAVALERLFFAKNAKTAMAVSEARGILLLTAALAELKLYEYTPLEVKKVVTGYGRADKEQVKKMVRLTLPETTNLKGRDDVFDAIAIALTCLIRENPSGKSYENYLS